MWSYSFQVLPSCQLQELESACPTGFYQTIKRKIITMKEGKKQRGADPMEQCDSGLILARVTALMGTRAINLNDVLKVRAGSSSHIHLR